MEGRKPRFLSMVMGQHGCYPWLACLRGVRCPCWLQTWEWILVPKPSSRYCLKSKLQGAYYYWEGILMHVLQRYQIPLTLATFVNCYKHLSSRRPNNQALWLSDKTTTLVGAASSSTYVVMLGCSSSMAEHLVTNQGSSLTWQMWGITLSIILLTHLQFGKLLNISRW
jgi:hypothetical protein